METVFILLAVLAAFGIVACVSGYDSTDRFDSAEWERRAHWQAFGGDGKLCD